MKNIFKNSWFLGVAAIALGVTAVSCEDQPDKFELTTGSPVVKYVRTTTSPDSLITGAYLDNLVCLVGENLTSVRELYFNDKKAILNTSYITENTLLVAVPGGIPEVVTNKIYMINTANDTTTYDFNVLVPGPSVRSISNEFAHAGEEVTLYGDYFIDDPNIPLNISFAGNIDVPYSSITSINKTAITFIVPENATPGYMNVKSLYGNGRSAFQFRDTRNILFDWDGSHGGYETAHGWRNGVIHTPGQDEGIEAVDGNYLYFGGAELKGEIGGSWAEDQFCFNYWPEPSAGYDNLCDRPEFAEMIATYGLENLQLKFECYIPSSSPWQSCALQMMFTPNSLVDYSSGNNTYYGEPSLPRGLWNPWQKTGSYDTGNKWVTISQQLNTFTFTNEGGAASRGLQPTDLQGLTFFVWHGGVAGTDCAPVMLIDNIRVVPIE